MKRTAETKDCEVVEDELKQNRSAKQSRVEVCKSVNEVVDGADDCEENENKQCRNNRVRFVQVTRTKQNAQVESSGELNYKDSTNTGSRIGKSKKHREKEKFINDEHLETNIKRKSSVRSEANKIRKVTVADGTYVHGDEKCDYDIVMYHKMRPIKMESPAVITTDNSDEEDLGNEGKLSTETHEVISKDEKHVRDDDGDGGACRYEARSVEMGSKSVITIDDDDDSRSQDDIDIIIVDEDEEEELGSKARTSIKTKAEEDLNISDVEIEVIRSGGVAGIESCDVPEELIVKGSSDKKRKLGETDGKEHGKIFIKECAEEIKIEPTDSLKLPDNRNSLSEEVSNPYPDLSNDVKAETYFQAEGSSEVIEDGSDSRLVIDEIKEENQSDTNCEPVSGSCSGSCKAETLDLEHTTTASGNEMTTGERETYEFYECSGTKDENNRVRCFTCKKSFPSQRVLAKHILNHTGGKVFPCDECCMQFILMSQLTAHKDKKHLKTVYNCRHCGVPFNTRSKLMNHVSIHTGERPYYCGGCGDMFTSNSDLVEHRLKSGERPFYCEKCGARFPWKSMLRVHQNVHGEIKKSNVCPVCSQAFRYSVLLLMHQVTAGHGIPYWYDEGLNALNPKKQHGALKLCFHMLKVAPRRVRGRLRILDNINASQMGKIQQIPMKKQMDVEDEMSPVAEIKDEMLPSERTKGPKQMSTYKERSEGGCYKRTYIKQTQKSSKCCK